jgi:hypothetical protein
MTPIAGEGLPGLPNASGARQKPLLHARRIANEELNFAIDELRLRPADRARFVPLELNDSFSVQASKIRVAITRDP